MENVGSPESEELQLKIHASELEVQQYIVALKAENAKHQKRIVKLEAQNLSAFNRIAAFEQDMKEREHDPGPSSIHLTIVKSENS